MTRRVEAWNPLLDYYASHRNSVADLYPSERVFLPSIAAQVSSVLDVGCATGGFSRIMRELNPDIRYVGVDSNRRFIERARRDFPDVEFHVSDGVELPFASGSFDLVHCSGVLHLTRAYARVMSAMWRQSSRFLLADLRLTPGPSVEGVLRVADEVPELPYVVLNADEAVAIVRSLQPMPSRVTVRGYAHAPSASATLPHGTDVFMAFFLAERGPGGATAVDLSLLPSESGAR